MIEFKLNDFVSELRLTWKALRDFETECTSFDNFADLLGAGEAKQSDIIMFLYFCLDRKLDCETLFDCYDQFYYLDRIFWVILSKRGFEKEEIEKILYTEQESSKQNDTKKK